MKHWILSLLTFTCILAGCDSALYTTSSGISDKMNNENEVTENDNEPAESGMRLVTALRGRYYFENKNAEYEELFEYDDYNRVIKWTYNYLTTGAGDTYIFNYEDNICNVYFIHNHTEKSEHVLTITFDGNNAISIVDNDGNIYSFAYNEIDELTTMVYNSEFRNWTDTYLWSNGNLLYAMDGEEILESYEYYDIENKCNVEIYTIDWYRCEFGLLKDRAVYGNMMGKDLLKKMDDTEFKYEFDDDGYVTKVFYYEDDELQVELNVEYNY